MHRRGSDVSDREAQLVELREQRSSTRRPSALTMSWPTRARPLEGPSTGRRGTAQLRKQTDNLRARTARISRCTAVRQRSDRSLRRCEPPSTTNGTAARRTTALRDSGANGGRTSCAALSVVPAFRDTSPGSVRSAVPAGDRSALHLTYDFGTASAHFGSQPALTPHTPILAPRQVARAGAQPSRPNSKRGENQVWRDPPGPGIASECLPACIAPRSLLCVRRRGWASTATRARKTQ